MGNRIRIFSILFFLCDVSFAQGILPKNQPPPPKSPPSPYVLIGETIPNDLTVLDANEKTRILSSYKTATDALVIGFFSPRCDTNQAAWSSLKRIYDDYKGWHMDFLGVSVQQDETLTELADAMKKAGLPYPVVRDEDQKVAHKLHATAIPEIIVLDQWNQLRYRGSVDPKPLRQALDAIVGQERVLQPETTTMPGCPIQ